MPPPSIKHEVNFPKAASSLPPIGSHDKRAANQIHTPESQQMIVLPPLLFCILSFFSLSVEVDCFFNPF